jgi:hypothetical protein
VAFRTITRLSKDKNELSNTGPLEKKIEDIFKELECVFKCSIDSDYKSRIVYGCQLIVYAMRCGAVSADKLAEGFMCCGQHDTATPTGTNSTRLRLNAITKFLKKI